MRYQTTLRYRTVSLPVAVCLHRRCFTSSYSRRQGFTVTCQATADPSNIFTYCDRQCSPDTWRRPLHSTTQSGALETSPIVALGKFDALHRGHRELATAAASMGAPWLVSFAGIAEVLGWRPRLPLVAACDRKRVLSTWKDACGGVTPSECAIPFADVRSMSPEEFVQLLARELRVAGVVVGANYRFGYKAAGTTELLKELGPKYGLKVKIIDLVKDDDSVQSTEQNLAAVDGKFAPNVMVSSSRVRHALQEGELNIVRECLDRPFRLVVAIDSSDVSLDGSICVGPTSLLNQPPAAGKYAVRAHVASAVGILVDGVRLESEIESTCEISHHELRLEHCPVAVDGPRRLVLDFI